MAQPRPERSLPRDESVERELGVPFPGQILPPEQWSRTALKQLPASGPIDWDALFGRSGVRVLELGCGNARFLIGSAIARPDCDHLGTDSLPMVIRYATRRANQRGLANIRFAVADGAALLERHIAAASIDELHVYHPQPYTPHQWQRRLLQPGMLWLAHVALRSTGRLLLQTDNADYWRMLLATLPAFFEVSPRDTPWPESGAARTRRELVATRQGLPIFRAEARPRVGLDRAAAETKCGEALAQWVRRTHATGDSRGGPAGKKASRRRRS